MELDIEEFRAPETKADLTLRQRRRAVTAAILGNGLEFYDFVTFAFFAIQIGRTFFPSESSFLSLMGALATFGAGFITRPLGAYLIGGYADRHGRKPAMLFSMLLMGCGILLLVLTPGYAAIGIAAPILAVIARLMQGLALGGEVGSATAYMMESARDHSRGFMISWQGASQGIAATIGAAVGLLLSHMLTGEELTSYGWRIALALGATIVPFALYIRNSLPETHEIDHKAPVEKVPLLPHLRVIVLGVAMIASGTIATYIFNYMATYGQNTLKLSEQISFAGETVNNGMSVVAILIGGALSDRIGRRTVMVAPQIIFALTIVPCFLWLTSMRDLTSFIGANAVLAFFSSFGWGAIYAGISESLPPAIRARTFALVYSVPVALFGGTTQMVVTWLLKVTGNPMSIAWYLTAVTLIGLVAMVLMIESAPVRKANGLAPPVPAE
ncbi:MAG: MFS transporter [Novosphingobium sp.]